MRIALFSQSGTFEEGMSGIGDILNRRLALEVYHENPQFAGLVKESSLLRLLVTQLKTSKESSHKACLEVLGAVLSDVLNQAQLRQRSTAYNTVDDPLKLGEYDVQIGAHGLTVDLGLYTGNHQNLHGPVAEKKHRLLWLFADRFLWFFQAITGDSSCHKTTVAFFRHLPSVDPRIAFRVVLPLDSDAGFLFPGLLRCLLNNGLSTYGLLLWMLNTSGYMAHISLAGLVDTNGTETPEAKKMIAQWASWGYERFAKVFSPKKNDPYAGWSAAAVLVTRVGDIEKAQGATKQVIDWLCAISNPWCFDMKFMLALAKHLLLVATAIDNKQSRGNLFDFFCQSQVFTLMVVGVNKVRTEPTDHWLKLMNVTLFYILDGHQTFANNLMKSLRNDTSPETTSFFLAVLYATAKHGTSQPRYLKLAMELLCERLTVDDFNDLFMAKVLGIYLHVCSIASKESFTQAMTHFLQIDGVQKAVQDYPAKTNTPDPLWRILEDNLPSWQALENKTR